MADAIALTGRRPRSTNTEAFSSSCQSLATEQHALTKAQWLSERLVRSRLPRVPFAAKGIRPVRVPNLLRSDRWDS